MTDTPSDPEAEAYSLLNEVVTLSKNGQGYKRPLGGTPGVAAAGAWCEGRAGSVGQEDELSIPGDLLRLSEAQRAKQDEEQRQYEFKERVRQNQEQLQMMEKTQRFFD